MASPAASPPRTEAPVDRRRSTTPSPSRAADDRRLWGLSRGDRWFLSVMLAVLAGLLAMHYRRDAARESEPVAVVRPQSPDYVFQLDPNTATWVEWTQLDGIGGTLAKRIVAHREEHGPFRTPEDLGRVKGIGPKTLDKMRPHLAFTSAEDAP
uniref:Helix-hairpin-helix domain-containing protein n=1 Tax=Schlesneria paludicola TaxID=360056 RepID=A0A7C2PGZ8_9PLAN